MAKKYPKLKTNVMGTIIRAKYDTVDTKIHATLQYAGDTAAGTSFTFKDNAAADLLFADDRFGLSWSFDNSCKLVGSFHISGEADISEWFSTDDGKTWQRLS